MSGLGRLAVDSGVRHRGRPELIRRSPQLDEFERAQEHSRPDQARNLRIANGLLAEARMLGIIPLKNPLEGIEIDIEYARALRRVRKPS